MSKKQRISSISTLETSIDVMIKEIHVLDGVKWVDLNVKPDELRPRLSLRMGQCFNWKKAGDGDLWFGVVGPYALAVKETDSTTLFSLLNYNDMKDNKDEDLLEYLYRYFQLEYSLKDLYELWSSKCARMEVVTKHLQGVRVVRQDPWECLVSFICSSNNNIKRIHLMLDRLRFHYGKYICSLIPIVEGKTPNTVQWKLVYSAPTEAGNDQIKSPMPSKSKTKKRTKIENEDDDIDNENENEEPLETSGLSPIHLYEFPTIESLAAVTEDHMRTLGMGYRAKFLINSAKYLDAQPNGGNQWLQSLRDASVSSSSRLEVQTKLQELPGVGRKVADCVALFSLDQAEAIPVDVHVWDIAVRDYSSALKDAKSLTPTIYEQVGDIFRSKFTSKAGWAHSVLFAAELPEFRKFLPTLLQEEMKEFVLERKEAKAQKKLEKEQNKKQETEKPQKKKPKEKNE
jgi:N-glycosylase/DNA lyase